MDRKKVIYIGVLLIVTILISVTYFSYAFFTSTIEDHGKLNIVAGDLNYKIESNDLINNSINLEANEAKTIEINITSLNDINSKYELYYTSTNDNISIGYKNTNDTPTGVINKEETKMIIITIKNKSNESNTITFDVIGGFITNQLVLETGNSITDIIYTVTLNANGGTVNTSELYIISGEVIGELETPTGGNGVFEGWYLENNFLTKVTSSYVVNNSITLYAKWISELYLYKSGTISPLVQSFTKKSGNGESGSTCINNVSYNSTYIRLQSGNGSQNNCGVGIVSNNKIDISGYSKLCVNFTHSNANCNYSAGTFQFGIASSQNAYKLNGITGWTNLITYSQNTCLDISQYNDIYYLILHNYYTGYSDITAVYLTN